MRATHITLGLASFGLAIVSATLPGCESSPMYCLVANSKFAAQFQQSSGDPGCLEKDAQEVYFNFFLKESQDAKRGDPKAPRLSFALAGATTRWEQAKDRVALLAQYAKCPSKDPAINTTPDASFVSNIYYSLSDFKGYIPDENDFCHADTFGEASINLPALDRVPACAEDPDLQEEQPALEALSVKYKLLSSKVLNRPASQGVFVEGEMEYSKPNCRGVYRFVAIAPKVACAAQTDCSAEQGIPEDIVAKGVTCVGASGTPDTKDGLCVVSPAAAL